VRALLDFYKEPDPRVLAARQQSHEELKLEEVWNRSNFRPTHNHWPSSRHISKQFSSQA